MPSSWLQKIVFFILFYRSVISCKSFSKQGLKHPDKVIGEVYSYMGAEMGNPYPVDKTLHRVLLRDLRSIDEIPDLETDGFTYVTKSPVLGIESLTDFSPKHKAALEADALRLVQDLTGAKIAVASSGFYRDHTSPNIPNPVQMIHSDLSPEGASWMKNQEQRVMSISKDPEKVAFARHIRAGKKVVIYKVWRPLETVHDNHLGFCKWDPVLKEKDALKSHINPTYALNALQPWRYSERQRWFYLNNMERHEAFVFKQHDDRAVDHHGVNAPHASFNLQGHKGQDRRKSFEVKIFTIFDSPSTDALEIKKSSFQLKKHLNKLLPNIINIPSRNSKEKKHR